MFDSIRDIISSRRASARAELLIAKAKHRTDRSSVSRLASAVEGIQSMLTMWLKQPSASESPDGVDIIIPHLLRGLANGVMAVADHSDERTEVKRNAATAKSDEQRKADELARIVGVVYMSIGRGKSVSILVDASAVDGLAATLSDLFIRTKVMITIEDADEPGKSRLLINSGEATASDDDGGGNVH
jgi:hypothetical protein